MIYSAKEVMDQISELFDCEYYYDIDTDKLVITKKKEIDSKK